MNRIIYILLSVLLFVSCSDELYEDLEGGGDKVTLNFSVNVPGTSVAGTRAMGNMSDDKRQRLNLWLVVFDKEGFLVESAIAQEQTNSGDETKFTVVLSRSTQKRIIHFVAVDFEDADTDKDGKNDSIAWNKKMHNLPYGHETEVIKALKVPSPTDAYWQRTTVNTIHEDTKFTRIPLVRNFAQVNITTSTKLTDFVLEGFAVCHAPSSGTLAPYNSSTGEFVDYLPSANSDTSKVYSQLLSGGYHGITPTDVEYQNIPTGDGDGGLTFDTNPKYLYEIPNSQGTSKGLTYVIVKGKYNGGNSTYYKVDLVKRGTTGMEYYDVLRNILYKGEIQSVTADGYSSAYQASQAAASNNISASTTTSGVSNISDGKQRIFVSNTFIVITKNEPVTMKYKYIPNIANGETRDNGIVSYNANKKLSFADLDNGTTDDSDGWRTLTITPNKTVPTGGSIEEDIIHFYVNTGSDDDEILTRDVQVIYREPYTLGVTCPAEVVKTSGTAVTVTLQISKDFNEKMFPLTFKVEPSPKTLYPDASQNSLPVQLGKSLKDGTTNSFWYEKTITWEDYQTLNAPDGKNYKELPCYFLTNCAESAATIYAYNEYCNLASCSLKNPYEFNDITLSGAQYYGKGQTVTLDIDISDNEKPLTITISEDGVANQTITWVSGQTSYTYTTKIFGGKITATVSDGSDTKTSTQARTTLKKPTFTATGDGLSQDYSYKSGNGRNSRTYSYSASNQIVTIKKGNSSIGSGTISTSGFVSDVVVGEGLNESDNLTLEYSFTPTSNNRKGTTQTRTVTTTLSALLSGTTTLNFTE